MNINTSSNSNINQRQEQCFVDDCKQKLINGFEKEQIIKALKRFMIICQTGYRTYPIIIAFLNELENN